jgi:anaerobic selenocysteine-containing dehydrogenase
MSEITKYRTCHLCEAMCGVEIVLKNGEVKKIFGDKKDPFSKGHICPKAIGLKDLHYDTNRLKKPLKKVNNDWIEISWEQAIEEVSEKLYQLQEKNGRNAIAIYSGNPSVHNLGTILGAPLFYKTIKSKNMFSATSADQLAHHLAAATMFGHSNLLPVPDLHRTHHWLILGGNPMVSNGSMMTAPNARKLIKDIKQKGKVVVIDPRFTETAKKASEHHFIKPASDVWLLLAMIKIILDEKLVKLNHIEPYIEAKEITTLTNLLIRLDLEYVSQKTGIKHETIYSITKDFINAESASIYGRLGLSTVEYGSLSIWAINILNILSGNFDTPGGIMFPKPAIQVVHSEKAVLKFNRWQSTVRKLPEFNGELPVSTLAEEIFNKKESKINALISVCGNPVLSTPNGKQLEKAIDSLEFMVSIDIYLNETTKNADYILPPASGLEVPHYDYIFNNLAIKNTAKYSDPIIPKSKDALYDFEIFKKLTIALIKKREKTEKPFQQTKMLNALTLDYLVDNGLKKGSYDLDLEKLKKHPNGIDLGYLKPRIDEILLFEDKKIRLLNDIYNIEITKLLNSKKSISNSLSLIGRRNLRSNNSWMHNSQSLMKGSNICNLLIHPNDAKKRNITNGDLVEIKSRVGSVKIIADVNDEICEGVISMPHGWGHHRKGIKLDIAAANPGVSINDLTDDQFVEKLTGVAIFSGVDVEVKLCK